MQRLQLKLAIVASGKSQRRVASDSGITENRLSEIVCGWVAPTPAERSRIASAVGQSAGLLFDDAVEGGSGVTK